jgi:hypothetical protein
VLTVISGASRAGVAGGPARRRDRRRRVDRTPLGPAARRHLKSGCRHDVLADGNGNDSLGYDLQVTTDHGKVLYEVRSTVDDTPQFALGESEVRRAGELAAGEQYGVLFVTQVLDSDRQRLHPLPNPLGTGMRYFRLAGQHAATVRAHPPVTTHRSGVAAAPVPNRPSTPGRLDYAASPPLGPSTRVVVAGDAVPARPRSSPTWRRGAAALVGVLGYLVERATSVTNDQSGEVVGVQSLRTDKRGEQLACARGPMKLPCLPSEIDQEAQPVVDDRRPLNARPSPLGVR